MNRVDEIIQIEEPAKSIFATDTSEWRIRVVDQKLVNILAVPVEQLIAARHAEKMAAAIPARWKL